VFASGAMSEFTSKFVDEGAPARTADDEARQPVESPASGSTAAASTAAASTRSPPAFLGWQRSVRSEYAKAVIAIAALAVAAFVLGRLGASRLPAPSSARPSVPLQPASGAAVTHPGLAKLEAEPRAVAAQPGAHAAIPFVQVAVEPPHGEIWLDQTVAGVGSVQLGAIDDGSLHELRFMAPGYETTTLFFRNTPPPGRVVLRRMARHAAADSAPAARSDTARSEVPTTHRRDPPSVDRVTRRVDAEVEPSNAVAPVAAQPAPRARPSAGDAPSDASAAPQLLPRVKLIEVHIPRVEVLD
jgi:hypothetical protein